MKTLLLVLALALGALLAIFGTQNTEPVHVRFLYWNTDAFPLALVILASALLGLVIGYLLSLRGLVRRTLESRRQGRRISELEAHPSPEHAGEADTTRSPR